MSRAFDTLKMVNPMTVDAAGMMRIIYQMAGPRPKEGPWAIDVLELERQLIEADAAMEQAMSSDMLPPR